ncbi:GntR family transcriptional regulator [Amycolatopsis sacchari]|uniref:GntR family transcriptional regulator n=1 Tax=Amycolatopsis sacchari TaxID=115433 RepID=UPI003D72136D
MDPDAKIDFEASLYPYQQLAGILRARVARGDWKPGKIIPSESRLVQEYGISRDTARRAIRVLVEEGLLFTVPQRGTFVRER